MKETQNVVIILVFRINRLLKVYMYLYMSSYMYMHNTHVYTYIYITQIYITMFFLSFLSRFLLLDMFGYILLYVGHTLILIFLNILVLTSKRGKKRKKQGGKRTVGSSPLSSNGGETSPPGRATAMEAHLPVYPHLCDQKQ